MLTQASPDRASKKKVRKDKRAEVCTQSRALYTHCLALKNEMKAEYPKPDVLAEYAETFREITASLQRWERVPESNEMALRAQALSEILLSVVTFHEVIGTTRSATLDLRLQQTEQVIGWWRDAALAAIDAELSWWPGVTHATPMDGQAPAGLHSKTCPGPPSTPSPLSPSPP